MTEAAVVDAIVAFDGVERVVNEEDSFFFVGDERMLPFATLVTSDRHDQVSDLDRPGMFRLNIGVGKETFRALFGSQQMPAPADGEGVPGYDHTVLDQVLPHPVYALMNWVCILNPSEATFETHVRPLLTEAHALASRKAARREERAQP